MKDFQPDVRQPRGSICQGLGWGQYACLLPLVIDDMAIEIQFGCHHHRLLETFLPNLC